MSALFNTHTLMGVVSQMPRPSSFLLDSFFPMLQLEEGEEIHFDVRDGNRRLAPFVSPKVAGRIVESEGFRTHTFKPAYIKDKRIFDAERPMKRAIGERIGGDWSPSDRIRLNLANEIDDQIRMINRRLEVMAAEALRTGRVTVSGEDYPTVVVDFGRHGDNTVTLSGGDRWGQSAVKPLHDLDTWALTVMRRTGARPTVVVMDVDAWRIFKADLEVQTRLDVRRVEGNGLQMQGAQAIGGTYMGRLDGFEIYVYADWFIDPEDGQEKPVLPSGTVLMGSRAVEGVRAFGAIRDEEAGYRPMAYFPKSWTDHDPSVRYLLMQSAPLVVPTVPNASFCATVL